LSQYVFDNAASQTAQRFGSLAALHDPTTVRLLEFLGVGDGWACWEVGGGGGSIAAWLARQVGDGGHVLATDIDPRFLTGLASAGLANLAVQRHDVVRDPLPSERFELIHARLVLLHLPTADQVLHQLVLALKPGGSLLIEDYDPRFLDRTFPTADRGAAAVFQRVYAAVAHVLELHGQPPGWGHKLYQRLRAEGLDEVGMEGHLAVWAGGSERARLDRANVEQVRAEAVARGLITDDEIDQGLALLEDPTVAFSSPVLFSAWGRRPAP
jgi:2-polyprenyl-3-methyl-5-hydroxy-6-metoxy-1,4-benzoquinol methylase